MVTIWLPYTKILHLEHPDIQILLFGSYIIGNKIFGNEGTFFCWFVLIPAISQNFNRNNWKGIQGAHQGQKNTNLKCFEIHFTTIFFFNFKILGESFFSFLHFLSKFFFLFHIHLFCYLWIKLIKIQPWWLSGLRRYLKF